MNLGSKIDKILEDTVALVGLTRRGVDYSLFNKIAISSSIGMNEWSEYLHLTERTLQRYKKEKKTFEQPYSDKILEIAQLYKRGEEVFGDTILFNKWLNLNIVALGGVTPKSLLDSSFGIELLKDELIRIEHGVLA